MKLRIGQTVRLSGQPNMVVGVMPDKWVIWTADGFLKVAPIDPEYTPLGLYRFGSDQVEYVILQSPGKDGGHAHTMHKASMLTVAEDGAEIFDCDFIETPVFLITGDGPVSIDSAPAVAKHRRRVQLSIGNNF